MAQFIASLQVNVTVEDSGSLRTHNGLVVVISERELLHLVASDMVSTSNSAIDMLEFVICEAMRFLLRHLSKVIVELEHAILLRHRKAV